LNTSIYTGSDQKTLRPVVNLSKMRLTKSLTNNRLQSDNKRVRKENTSLEHTRDEYLSLNHTENLDLSFPSNNSSTQSPRTHLSGKVIALPTLGFSKLLLRTLIELSYSHNTSTLAS